MKYAIWFVRLVFAAWFIPAGLNHFIPLFPQPMGNQPLSTELITALIDSHLFDLVKAVELIAGISVLTGYYMPLMLVVCMPVSFCVWYWDTPLQGWGTTSAIYGWAALGSNALLCLACFGSYRALFALSATPRPPSFKQLLLAGRLVFGAWMLVSGLNYFAGTLYPMPTGHEPLAVQLMSAFVDTSLMGVAMGIELVTGVLIIAGVFVPAALCVVMPVNVCAAYWAVVLEHQPLGAVLSLVAVALNALLMLALLDAYKDMLARRALMAGESDVDGGSFDRTYAIPIGGVSTAQFGAALVPLLAAVALYYFVVSGVTGKYCLIMLLIPTAVLLARLAQGMKRTA